MSYGENTRAPPVKEGEKIDVYVQAKGEKGDGIAKKMGFVIFIPNADVGEYVKIKITKVLAKVCFAEVVEKLEVPKQQQIVPPPKKEEFKGEPSEDFGEE